MLAIMSDITNMISYNCGLLGAERKLSVPPSGGGEQLGGCM
jgi:hypothetical protein